MTKILRLAAITLFLHLTVSAQPKDKYTFTVIAQPGTTIGDHTFTPTTKIGAGALNDAGLAAFIAHWPEGENPHRVGVFTSSRTVAMQGDDYEDGSWLVVIPEDSQIVINSAGHVAYEGQYAGDGAFGIFCERRLVLGPSFPRPRRPFSLTDDDQIIATLEMTAVVTETPNSRIPPTTGNRTSILDGIKIKPPKLPSYVPLTTAPGPKAATPKPAPPPAKKPITTVSRPSPIVDVLATNHRGQVLVSVKLSPTGFMLLLGTPTSH